MRDYPKIGLIHNIAKQQYRHYRCEFCGKTNVNKEVFVYKDPQETISDTDIFFFHSECLQGLKEVQILAKLYPDKFATLTD
jgi:hypothetical protein